MRDAAEKDCDEQAGNPVVVSTGNKVESVLDFSSAGEMGLYLQCSQLSAAPTCATRFDTIPIAISLIYKAMTKS